MFHAVHVRLNPFIMLSSDHMRSDLHIENCCSGAVACPALLCCQRPDHQVCRHDSIRSISISTSFTNVLSWYSVTMGSVPSSRHPCVSFRHQFPGVETVPTCTARAKWWSFSGIIVHSEVDLLPPCLLRLGDGEAELATVDEEDPRTGARTGVGCMWKKIASETDAQRETGRSGG